MLKGQFIREKAVVSRNNDKNSIKMKPKTRGHPDMIKPDQLLRVYPENKQRSVSNKKKKTQNKPLKPKKIKFLTEGIQQSTNDWLAVPSPMATKSSLRQTSGSHDPHENAYELTRTFKKHKKQDNQQPKSRKPSDQIDVTPSEISKLNRLKLRNGKGYSNSSRKSSLSNFKKLDGLKKSKRSNPPKLLPKTSSGSNNSPEGKKKHYLSPQVVKLESSYCFQSEEEQQGKPYHHQRQIKGTKSYSLFPPKFQQFHLFDSDVSVWKHMPPPTLLKSTIDLLN